MRKLNGYVARTVLASIFVVFLVILALDVIAAVVDEIDNISKQYDFREAMIYVGLTLPTRIYNSIPLAALTGCLIGLGQLAGTSELVIMRAAGVSVTRIAWAVMKPVFFLILVAAALGEYVTPWTDQMAESRKAIAKGDRQQQEGQQGLWSREGEEFLHFNVVMPNGKMMGVTRYQYDEKQNLVSVSFAEAATYQGGYWLEEKGVITHLDPEAAAQEGKANTSTETFLTRRWDTNLSPDLVNVLVMPPRSLAIQTLYTYASYLDQHGQKSAPYWLAFWQKSLQPLATAGLVLIAISFIFGPLREVTMGYRVFTGVIVAIVFRMSQDLLGPSSIVFGFPPLLAVLIPIGICIAIGFWLLSRTR
ncbi:LPS export ABC transporter permease LptG [Simiduia litorea]|uniref:LPS export ABC transporter permease LptG n=1 Tax=Simiduia litorea TaxID=1435348 RepID=UPI0036F2B6A5